MKSILIIGFFTVAVCVHYGHCQGLKIEIGDPADKVATLVRWAANEQRAGFDAHYSNGQINDVVACFANKVIIEFRLQTNLCNHYVMEGGKLAYTLTQYEQISIERLRELYDRTYRDDKISEYYFSDDLQTYSKLYLHSNGMATVERRQTNVTEFPTASRISISKELEIREARLTKERERIEQENKERSDIESKIYDIQQHDTAMYNFQRAELKRSVLKHLRQLRQRNITPEKPFYSFGPNTYNVISTLKIDRSHFDELDCQFVSGTDKGCSLFKVPLTASNSVVTSMITTSLRPIFIKEIEVRTKASFENFAVEYYSGTIQVKKNGKGDIEYVGKFPEVEIAKTKLNNAIENYAKGKFKIAYEIGSIDKEDFAVIEEM